MVDQIFSELKTKSEAALHHLHQEYGKLQTGRASSALVENIPVESFGAKVPMKGVATITIPEPQQIAIQPFNRDQLVNIEKAIMDANIGLTPQNDGNFIRLNIPPLTEERRKELVKLVHKYAEESKISLRNARHDAINQLKQLEKEKSLSEDELRSNEKKVQDTVDDFNQKIDDNSKKKEQDVMTI